jgi:hypothetical protein
MKKLNEILVYTFMLGATGCLIAMCIVLFGH